jgi:gas vesicle protein
MTAPFEPGQLLAVDGTARPRVAWSAYQDGGETWAACYVDGGLLRQGPEGWWRLGAKDRKTKVTDKTLDRARACQPDDPPVWPGQQDLGGAHPAGDQAVLVTVAKVAPERVRWLWPAHIPLGKVSVLDGDPGLGKSTLTLDLAARVTTGSPLPDGVRLDYPGAVLIISAEDGIGDTIRPRLEAAGADLERVSVLDAVEYWEDHGPEQRPPVLPADVPIIEEAIARIGAVLVVIDPLAAFLSERVDSYKDQHVRRALMPLARLAERAGAAIVIVRHLSKTGGANAVYRGGGSIGIIGAARAGLLVAPDPDDETRRILAVTKSNLAQMPPALAYRLVPDELHDCGRIIWEGPTSHKANDLLTTPITVDLEQSSAITAAVAFLEEVLDEEDRWVKEVKDEAKLAELSWPTVRRAKDRRGVKAVKVGGKGSKEQGWKWHLPALGRCSNPVEGAQGPESKSAGQGEGVQEHQTHEHHERLHVENPAEDTP